MPERYDPSEGEFWKVLIYGDPGAGKTRLCATVCYSRPMAEVLWLNVEGGMATLRDMEGIKRWPLVEYIDTTQEMEQLWYKLRDRHDEEGSPYQKVNTIVIDNGTELVPVDLERVVRRKTEKEIAERTPGTKARRFGLDDVWLDDQGETGRRLARLFRWYRDLDVNLLITAHARYMYDRKPDGSPGALSAVRSEFPPAIRRAVEGYQDCVWFLHFDRASGRRCLLTDQRGPYFAKTRGEKFQKAIGNVVEVPIDRPTMADLFETWRSGKALDPAYHHTEEENKDDGEKAEAETEG